MFLMRSELKNKTPTKFRKMLKTDRQTDKGMIWSVTAFNDDIRIIKDKETYPAYVKQVLGQDEVCPDTGKEHFQGFLQLYTQQRISALKKWLPTAHFEICRNKDALKQYVQKDDTRAPDGDQIDNGSRVEYMPFDKLCKFLADTFLSIEDDWKEHGHTLTDKQMKDISKHQFVFIIRHLILNGYAHQAAAFADNRLKAFWIDTGSAWVELRRKEAEAEAPADSELP